MLLVPVYPFLNVVSLMLKKSSTVPYCCSEKDLHLLALKTVIMLFLVDCICQVPFKKDLAFIKW